MLGDSEAVRVVTYGVLRGSARSSLVPGSLVDENVAEPACASFRRTKLERSNHFQFPSQLTSLPLLRSTSVPVAFTFLDGRRSGRAHRVHRVVATLGDVVSTCVFGVPNGALGGLEGVASGAHVPTHAELALALAASPRRR